MLSRGVQIRTMGVNAVNLAEKIKTIKPRGKKVLFVCVGTDRSTGDSLGPIVGTRLKGRGYEVLGTIDEPVHAANLSETLSLIESKYPDHFVIAIDASLGRQKEVGNIKVAHGPLFPGSGVGKSLPPVGDARIVGCVNVGGFMEYFVLQNTRLSRVLRMADEIFQAITKAIRPPRRKKRRNALCEIAATAEKKTSTSH